jgi:glycogen synthase kinase 3 beta
MKQIFEGMKYVHSKKVTHRDLKPENILLTEEGVIKICDFGSAKVLDEEGSLNTPYIVSRYYRAPELILACSDYTNKIDIWGKYLIKFRSFMNKGQVTFCFNDENKF